jgi:hypothetical protein
MNQPSKKEEVRLTMPNTARFVDARRGEWGAPYVNDLLRRACREVDPEPGLFYAIEGNRILGMPFPATAPCAELQHMAICTGVKFAAFIAPPPGAVNGTD